MNFYEGGHTRKSLRTTVVTSGLFIHRKHNDWMLPLRTFYDDWWTVTPVQLWWSSNINIKEKLLITGHTTRKECHSTYHWHRRSLFKKVCLFLLETKCAIYSHDLHVEACCKVMTAYFVNFSPPIHTTSDPKSAPVACPLSCTFSLQNIKLTSH